MNENCRAEWEKMDITKDELTRLGKALKNEEFRKLLVEYAEEINDPANKKIYEDEIKQLEQERGVECTFINPEPGYVIKTSIDGQKKAFINVCMNDNIGKPTSAPSKNSSGARGLTWSLPYSHVAPHDDLDKKSARCTVFDVVFHSDTHRLAANNLQFKNMLNNTALDAVEENYHVKLDRKNLRFPKMSFKGSSRASIIRKKSSNPPAAVDEDSTLPPAFKFPFKDLPEKPQTIPKIDSQEKVQEEKHEKDPSPYTTPKYTIKYRNSVDIQDWTNDKDSKMNAAIPKELVVSVFLPLLSTTADVELDVHEKWLELKSVKTAKYFLHLPLPYATDDQSGHAKFDVSERKLVITLPVKRSNVTTVELNREDSGIDSDAGLHSPDMQQIEESASKIQVISSESVSDDPERTTCEIIDNGAKSEHFLNPDVHYSPTNFTCNVHENVMAFTLHVKNVDPESVQHVCQEGNVLHLRFSSMGAGFFPLHYAFFLKLTAGFTFVENETSVEPWDNNVIVQLALNPAEAFLADYYAGVDEATATKHELPEPTIIAQKLALTATEEEPTDVKVEVTQSTEEEIVIEISPRKEESPTSESSDDACQEPQFAKPTQKTETEKSRSYSESSGDEQASSLTRKGILKCRSVSRSLSESNMDDFSSTSSLDPFPESFGSDLCIVEEEEERAARKTARVRFNEVIARQTFRINSSILGQRKKNQRKTLSKRRAQQRRASESEKEDDVETNNVGANLSSSCDNTAAVDMSSSRNDATAVHVSSSRNDTAAVDINMSSSRNDTAAVDINMSSSRNDTAAVDIDPTSSCDDVTPVDVKLENNCANPSSKKNKGRKKKSSSQSKHTAVKCDRLGFKNDLIFDLDM